MVKHLESNRRVLFALLLVAAGAQAACSTEPSVGGEELGTTQHALVAAELPAPAAAAQKAAQAQLLEWLNSIPAGQERPLGFFSREEYAEATLGTPYEMFSAGAGGSIEPLDVWRVPVLVRGEFRALLDVTKSGNDYVVSGIGAAVLANELGKVEQSKGGVGTPAQRSILRAFKQNADFVVYDLSPRDAKNRGQLKIRPLNSAQDSLSDKAKSVRAHGKLGAPGANGRIGELTIAEVQSLLDD